MNLQVGPMQPSNYLLDNFVAHKLSLLNECGAPELSEKSTWLNNFILNSVFIAKFPTKFQAYIFNFLRRTEGAFSAYREAHVALIEYVETPRNVLSPYFKALLNFEVCIAQCYQGYELLKTASGEKLFEPNDGSEMEKLHTLYIDSKHMDQMIDGGKLPPEATAAIWITNQGIESSRTTLQFADLFEMLLNMGRLANRLSTLGENSGLNTVVPTSIAPVG
ncbi:MAG: hypothetical protein WC633_06825 [Desulfurivibrionaceae bacterium]|jgi:hypothetical protein